MEPYKKYRMGVLLVSSNRTFNMLILCTVDSKVHNSESLFKIHPALLHM